MMTNPFDNAEGTFHVLVNDEGQHSLWPAFADIPAGWTAALRDADRQACIEYIETYWTDMRPRSLVAAMDDPKRTETADGNKFLLER